jgi:hypothetical protein
LKGVRDEYIAKQSIAMKRFMSNKGTIKAEVLSKDKNDEWVDKQISPKY